jgi:DNA cross-link repair 1C protein
MSVFPGTFPNLPGVSCDRFNGDNHNSDQFFLSHCHSDHMVGLDNLIMKLQKPNRVKVNHRIYCSMISKAFIVRKYPYLQEKWVKDLFPNQPVNIHVFDRTGDGGTMYQLRVTAIPANHCPGSVM